ALPVEQHARLLLRGELGEGGLVVARREDDLDELGRERLAERRPDRPVQHDHAPVGRDRVTRQRLLVGLVEGVSEADPARVPVLHDHGRRAVQLEGQEAGRREIAEVVEGKRPPLELLDPSEEMRPRALLRVVGAPLVRVLAVGEVEVALEDGNEDLRERVVATQPAGDRGVEGGGALEGARGEPAPGRIRDLAAHPELLDDGLVVLRAADRDDVRVVLRRRTEQSGAADVDLLDRILPGDVEAADRALEGVEVHADEVDRRDLVRAELRHVLGQVASREDAAVHSRVERDDAVAEKVAEARHVRERRHGDALVGEELRRAARREELDAEPGELARESGEAGLVVDREQGTADRHAAISSFTTSGRMRCSTRWTRARRVSGVSPGSTGTGSVRITGPVLIPSSTQWTVAAVCETPAASTSSIGCAPGKAGSGAECVLTTRRPKTWKNRGRSRCMYPAST